MVEKKGAPPMNLQRIPQGRQEEIQGGLAGVWVAGGWLVLGLLLARGQIATGWWEVGGIPTPSAPCRVTFDT